MAKHVHSRTSFAIGKVHIDGMVRWVEPTPNIISEKYLRRMKSFLWNHEALIICTSRKEPSRFTMEKLINRDPLISMKPV